jgi:hypothetical protein
VQDSSGPASPNCETYLRFNQEIFMTTTDSVFHRALSKMLIEIFDGPPGSETYLLNPGDPGFLKQLDAITAADASRRPMPGSTTIASHADHVLYGLELLNRWIAGEENPWADADWSASWKRTTVTDAQWETLRQKLRKASNDWQAAVVAKKEWDDIAASGALSSAAHTAYHFGAIRQIVAAMKL